jgi:hypothetical protein
LCDVSPIHSAPDPTSRAFRHFRRPIVAETLMPLILDLEEDYQGCQERSGLQAELENLNAHYAGRPSPLYFAERLTEHLGGAKIYFKRDELNHTGSAQDQQLPRPDPACQAHGQDPDHRRNRRRPAWRGHGNRCARFGCPAWSTWVRPT